MKRKACMAAADSHPCQLIFRRAQTRKTHARLMLGVQTRSGNTWLRFTQRVVDKGPRREAWPRRAPAPGRPRARGWRGAAPRASWARASAAPVGLPEPLGCAPPRKACCLRETPAAAAASEPAARGRRPPVPATCSDAGPRAAPRRARPRAWPLARPCAGQGAADTRETVARRAEPAPPASTRHPALREPSRSPCAAHLWPRPSAPGAAAPLADAARRHWQGALPSSSPPLACTLDSA